MIQFLPTALTAILAITLLASIATSAEAAASRCRKNGAVIACDYKLDAKSSRLNKPWRRLRR